MAPPSKICATCGRTMQWRKAWARNWDAVTYCSRGCRTHKPDATDRELEAAITALLDARARGATICPSEAARAVHPSDWRALMERSRQAARRLAAAGVVQVTQGGRVVDPSTARGAIRIRRAT